MKANIRNNKFLMGTLILLTGGFLSKFLGFLLKIIITRQIGTYGIGLYSLLMPTFGLFITVATLSFPTAISKLVSIPKRSSKKIVFSIIPISLLLNVISIIIIFLISKPLAFYFLNEQNLYYPIICIGFTLPFIGLSSIIKGYYWGKERMGIYILSNIVEQIVRIVILYKIIPIFINKSLVYTLCIIILVNIVSETSSIIVMILGLPKKISISKRDIKPCTQDIKDVLNISIPTTSSKIIGSIAHFIEPIILTQILSYVGYSKDFIVSEYGILNGYSLSLLLLPQFFTISISTQLIPELSKNYALGNIKKCKKRIKQIVILSFLIGFISSLIIYLFPKYFLNLIYNTTLGVNYIKILAPFLLLFFINTPLSYAMNAIDKSKESFYISLICSVIKLSLILILSLFKIGLYSVVISIIINLLVGTMLNYICIKKALNNHIVFKQQKIF